MIRFCLFTLVAAAVVGCGSDPFTPDPSPPALTSVNGASRPVLLPGERFVLRGTGFGSSAEGRTVVVTTASGRSAAAIESWSDRAIGARLPDDAASGTIAVARGPGDTLGPVPLFVSEPTTFDPATLDWKEGPAAPRRLARTQVATLRFPQGTTMSAIVVLMGGSDSDSTLTDRAWFGLAASGGGLDQWVGAPQDSFIPVPRRLHAMAGADPTTAPVGAVDTLFPAVAYLIGGADTLDRILTEVSGMGVNADGSYGLWTALIPLPAPRAGASALAAFGQLYVAGGFGRDSVASPDVQIATIETFGTLNGWFAGPPLPEGRAFGTLVRSGDMLYYIGGQTGLVVPDSTDPASPDLRGTVYAARISRRTGFILDSAWTEVGTLVRPRARHAAFALGDGLLVTAGVYADAPSAGESEFATLDGNGIPGAFTAVAAPTLADRGASLLRSMAFTALPDGAGRLHPVLIGGATGAGGAVRGVWWH